MRPARPVYTRSLRLRVDLPARLLLDGHRWDVHVIDISGRGAFVEADITPRVGASAQLRINLPTGELVTESTVARLGTAFRERTHPEVDVLVLRMRGVGLQFQKMSAAHRTLLESFIDQARTL